MWINTQVMMDGSEGTSPASFPRMTGSSTREAVKGKLQMYESPMITTEGEKKGRGPLWLAGSGLLKCTGADEHHVCATTAEQRGPERCWLLVARAQIPRVGDHSGLHSEGGSAEELRESPEPCDMKQKS